MPKEFLDPSQLQRSDQLYFTHKALSTINNAAKEAVKLHDKYVEAMEGVMAALLDNSDCMEETRRLFGPRGEATIAPTFEVTGKIVDAYHAWIACSEVKRLREDMEALADLSSTAKRSVKLAEKSSSDLEKAAQKAARFNTDKKQRKIGDGKTSRQKRLKEQQDEANAQVQTMDHAVVESMLAMGKWWSGKLVAVSEGLYVSYADGGAAATRLFPCQPASMRPPRESLAVGAGGSGGSPPSVESTPTTSQPNRHTIPSSPSAPSSSVNSQQRQRQQQQQQHRASTGGAATGGGSEGAAAQSLSLSPGPARHVAAAAAATNDSPPPPLFGGAAAGAAVQPATERSAGNGAATGGSGGVGHHADPAAPVTGAPLQFQSGDGAAPRPCRVD